MRWAHFLHDEWFPGESFARVSDEREFLISCHLSSVPISLLIPSYLPIETSGDSVSTISVDLIVL